MCFLRRGRTRACLNWDGKIPSDSERLMSMVMGRSREGRQAFSSLVGMVSSEHVESVEVSIACSISERVAGVKC